MNYAVQSELNISLLHSICMKAKNRKYHSIDLAIKVSVILSVHGVKSWKEKLHFRRS